MKRFIFADFRNFGFRVLVDVVCDLDDMYSDEKRKKNAVRTDTDSEGWYYAHIHNVIEAVLDNTENNSKSIVENALMLLTKFDKGWCNNVMQAQVSLYSKTTKGAWIICFEDIVAEAKESGPLENKDVELQAETVQKLKDALPNTKRLDVLVTLAKFYLANKPEDSEWVILPVENFNAYYGTTCFDRKWLPIFPESVIVRDEYSGACRFKVFL